MNDNLEIEEPFDIFQYVKENYVGLALFIFSFFIIYFVDYINGLNALIYSIPSPIPGLNINTNTNTNTNINTNNNLSSKKKIKKR
jgi:hypothetical protein